MTELAGIPHHGNPALWQHRPLLGLCCSRRYPAGVVLPTYTWAIAQREAGVGVASGFQSELEQDALHYLLAPRLAAGAAPPVVWVLATGLRRRYPAPVQQALAAGRLLVLAPMGAARLTAAAAQARNAWLLAHCPGPVVVPHAAPGGSLAALLAHTPPVRWQELPPTAERLL